ncbi:MAG TPA: hypothetical protein VE077_02860 [Candidatus Methylomirabilis sp.]|nr:hypothetical protein [Candidatus Methylomirabilis sp.]
MLFGHNTDVPFSGTVLHVQTEDRGSAHALIDTAVYHKGRVLLRRTNNYFDLLPLDHDREEQLRKRVDDQHRLIVEGIRSGALHIVLPPATPAVAPSAPAPTPQPASAAAAGVAPAPQAPNSNAAALTLELLNGKTWLQGKRAHLQVVVRRKEDHKVAAGALVTARVEGGDRPAEISDLSDSTGLARLEFSIPALLGEEACLVIEAMLGKLKGHVRFQMRAKSRAPFA